MAALTGLSLTWSKSPEDRVSRDEAQLWSNDKDKSSVVTWFLNYRTRKTCPLTHIGGFSSWYIGKLSFYIETLFFFFLMFYYFFLFYFFFFFLLLLLLKVPLILVKNMLILASYADIVLKTFTFLERLPQP